MKIQKKSLLAGDIRQNPKRSRQESHMKSYTKRFWLKETALRQDHMCAGLNELTLYS